MTGLQNGSAKCTITCNRIIKYHIFKVLQKSVSCNLLKQTPVLKVSANTREIHQFVGSKCPKTDSFQDHREQQHTKVQNLTPLSH